MRKLNKEDKTIKLLAETDFSKDCANKENIKNEVLFKLKQHQNNPAVSEPKANKKLRFKPVYIVAATLTLTLCFSMMAYGEDIVRIIKEFSVGEHAKYYVTDHETNISTLPEELKGQIFDAEGNELTEFPQNREQEIFNASGEPSKILVMTEAKETDNGFISNHTFSVVSPEEYEKATDARNKEMEAKYEYFANVDDAKPYLAFDFTMPAVFPKGFVFDRARIHKDGKDTLELSSKPGNKYFEYFLTNEDKTQEIYVQLRLMDEETAFGGSASHEMKEVTINGNKGVLDGNALDIEIDGVMYMFMAGGTDVSPDEVIKMAESLQ